VSRGHRQHTILPAPEHAGFHVCVCAIQSHYSTNHKVQSFMLILHLSCSNCSPRPPSQMVRMKMMMSLTCLLSWVSLSRVQIKDPGPHAPRQLDPGTPPTLPTGRPLLGRPMRMTDSKGTDTSASHCRDLAWQQFSMQDHNVQLQAVCCQSVLFRQLDKPDAGCLVKYPHASARSEKRAL